MTTIPHTGPYDADFDDPLFDVDLETYAPDADERSTAVLAHLSGFLIGIFGPMLVYFLKRDESRYVEDQSADAINFHLTMALAAVAFGILSVVVVGIPFLLAVVVLVLVSPIRAALAAHRGERFRYPFTARFVT